MDLARDAGALLGDGAAELGELDRAPGADEEDDEREHAQEVALRDSELASSGWNTRCSAAKSISVKPSASQRARSSPRRTKRAPQPTTATSVTSACSASVPVR